MVDAAERFELLEGLPLPAARTGHLIALKVLSRDDVTRPQHVMDLRALLRAAPAEELRRAVEAAALMRAAATTVDVISPRSCSD